MTKQEQIKEMAKDISYYTNVDCAYNRTNFDNPDVCYDCKFYKYGKQCEKRMVATELYNAGYRKIPENAIVLTKEEYIDLSRNYVGEQIEQARKETAKEFAEKLKEKTHNYYPSIDSYCCSRKVVELKDIYELLNEYEVEE